MKKTTKQKIKRILIVGPILFLLNGCGEQQKAVDIGFSACEKTTSRSVAMIRDVQDNIQDDDRTLELRCAENTLSQQMEDIRELIALHPKYLIVIPVKSLGLENVLAEASDAGIQVIILDRNMEQSAYQDYLTQISADAYEEGKFCAQMLGSYFGGREARILEVQGKQGSSLSNDRSRGFRDQLCAYENIQIVKVLYGDFDRIEASHCVKAYLDSGGTMDGIFAHSDEDGLGAMAALDDFNEQMKIPIVSVNGQQEVKEAILSDNYLATVYAEPQLGKYVMDVIKDYEAGNTIEKQITISSTLYDSQNILLMQEY